VVKEKEIGDPDADGHEDPAAGQVKVDMANEGSVENDIQDRYLRLTAEFDNFRKRTEREMVEFKRRAADDVLVALLEVIDNLDRALESTEECEPNDLEDGLIAIRNQMGAILQREGVESIKAVGVPFDPFEMEAVMRMPSEEVEEDSVVRELLKGYKGRGYVLRPSKVIVSAGPPAPVAPDDPHKGPEGNVSGDDIEVNFRK
jgi:molecular chaperone GrpE